MDLFAGTIPCAAAVGAAACAAAAIALLLVADPGSGAAQIAFYAASALAGFLTGLAAACRWVSGGDATVRPWRAGVFAGLALAGATGLAFAGMRLGLGVYWPLPPALLLAGLAFAGKRLKNP